MDAGGDPFDALVSAAGDDADAALALAAAYARAPKASRADLVEAVRAGAFAEGVPAVGPLAALLAVEVDPALAAQIRDTLFADAGRAEPSPALSRPTAWASGDEERGAIVLSRPLYGPFVDVVAVVWDEGRVVRTRVEPLMRHDAIARVSMSLPDASELRVTDYDSASERLVDVLWRHLRRGFGALPASLAAHV